MSIEKFGSYAAFVSGIAAAGYTVVQVLQVLGIVGKPLDDILIYGFSLCIAPPFLLAILSLYHSALPAKKMWVHAALLFAVMYNMFVLLMYTVQLTAVIPYHITNSMLTVAPHSLFWTIDALGYINMGIAALFLVPVFSRQGFEKYCKWFFLAHALITPVVALVYFYPTFSIPLLLLASPWSITATGSMLCLAIYFKRKL